MRISKKNIATYHLVLLEVARRVEEGVNLASLMEGRRINVGTKLVSFPIMNEQNLF